MFPNAYIFAIFGYFYGENPGKFLALQFFPRPGWKLSIQSNHSLVFLRMESVSWNNIPKPICMPDDEKAPLCLKFDNFHIAVQAKLWIFEFLVMHIAISRVQWVHSLALCKLFRNTWNINGNRSCLNGAP
jgi:hypothetical protein